MNKILFYLVFFVLCLTLYVPVQFFVDFKISKTVLDPRLYLFILFLIKSFEFKSAIFEKFECYFKEAKCKKIRVLLLMWGVHLLLNKLYSWLAILPSGADFSHFDYALWNTTKGHLLDVSIGEPTLRYWSLLGDHFSPILLFFTPLYMLFESHYVPMFYQALTAFVTSIILFKFSMLSMKNDYKYPVFTSMLVTISFCCSNLFLKTFNFEFHHEFFYVPLFIYLFFYYQKKQILTAVGFLLLILSVKEDAPIILLGVGGTLVFTEKSKRKLYGLGVICISGIYFILLKKVFMPYFEKDIILNEAQKFVGMWPKYGNSMNEVIVGVISNPLQVLKDIFTNKVFYKLYISWLFVPFKTFWVLLPSVAIIVFLIAEEPIRSLALYYSAPIIALIVISYIYGLNRFSSFNIKKIVSFAFALNLLIGIGGYRLASPRKDVFSIRESLDKRLSEVSIEKSKKIFISGHLLAQTDYRRDFRRIFDKTFFVREKDIINKVVIGKTVNNYPLNKSDVGNLIISLSENPLYEKEFEDQNIIIFRKL